MPAPLSGRMLWYIQQRLDFLKNRRENLKAQLDGGSEGDIDFEKLRELLEVTGRIRELQNLMTHIDSW